MRIKWGEWARERLDRQLILFIISACLLAGIYFWQLGHAPLSPSEVTNVQASASFHDLVNSPLNAPHNIFLYLLQHFGHHGRLALRSVSAVFCLIFIYCFYRILRNWFGIFSAWLGTLFFAATPFLILTGRSASATIMYLWPLTLIAAFMALVRSREQLSLRAFLLSLLAGLAVYQPGGFILLIIGTFYVRDSLSLFVSHLPRKVQILAGILLIACLAPMILAAIEHPYLLKNLFFIPSKWPNIVTFSKDVGWGLAAYVWQSGRHSDFQLGRLAILNAAQIILLAFGLFALWNRATAKLYVLGFIMLATALAFGLNDSYGLLLFGLPVLSLVITAGLRYLHLEWTSVFPRNPLPRGLAIFLLLTIVTLHLVWGIHYSLVAWPHRLPVI